MEIMLVPFLFEKHHLMFFPRLGNMKIPRIVESTKFTVKDWNLERCWVPYNINIEVQKKGT